MLRHNVDVLTQDESKVVSTTGLLSQGSLAPFASLILSNKPQILTVSIPTSPLGGEGYTDLFFGEVGTLNITGPNELATDPDITPKDFSLRS